MNTFTFTAALWLQPSTGAWYFFTVPPNTSLDIDFLFKHKKRGWGSLPVVVTIGKIMWETSIFYDSKRKAYLLPVKSSVRKAAKLLEGQSTEVKIKIVE